MKRLISVLLSAILIIGALVGCGSGSGSSDIPKDDPDKAVTLKMVFPNAKQKDTDRVQEAVNEKLKEFLPNTSIEFVMESEFETKWSLWMSTQKEMDLTHSGFKTNIEDEVRKESYIGLSDLVDEYAPTLKELQDKYWYLYDGAMIGGELYAIPNVQAYSNEALTLEIARSLSGYFDTKAIYEEAMANPKTTEKLMKLIDDGVQGALKSGADCTGLFMKNVINLAKRGYSFLGGNNSNICYDITSDDAKIIDFYTTDEFKCLSKYMKKWAGQGLISDEILTGQWTSKLSFRDMMTDELDKETGIIPSRLSHNPVNICLTNIETQTITREIGRGSTFWSIPFTSKNPVRAIKLLNLLHSEEGAEIANMIAFGFEGEHYEFTNKEKGEIRAFDYEGQGGSGSAYGVPVWEVTNMLQGVYAIAPYTRAMSDYAEKYYTEIVGSCKKHVLYDFQLEIDPVKVDLSKILRNNTELALSYYCGLSENSESVYKELMDKNKSANLEGVMNTIQSQIDKYLASK